MKAIYNISYGVYILTTASSKLNGCVVNTVAQITSSPTKVMVCVNKENFSCGEIQKSKIFNLSVLDMRTGFDIIEKFANNGSRVMVAGLDMDYRGRPFGIMPKLLAKAEFVTKLTAVCTRCGAPATRSLRFVDGKPSIADGETVLVGAKESYTAVCRCCYNELTSK